VVRRGRFARRRGGRAGRVTAIAALATAAVAVTVALGSGLAGADSFNPVRIAITIAPVARLAQPLAITVTVSADAGALDTATAPLRIRAKLADECGGTFDTTPGPMLIDSELNPQPATGQPYRATAHGAGSPTAYGHKTVCAFLEEEGDDRQFANDTVDPPMVDVSKPCTLAAARYDAAVKSLARAKRQLRHAKRRANRARLKKLVAKRSKTVARDRRAARSACGPGVPL
jgi:hypothetical protein